MEAKDYRRFARENLAGNWWLSVAVALVAGLLGGLLVGGFFSLEISEEVLNKLPPVVLKIIAAIATVAGILGIVRIIIGGTVQLGYATYLLKQHDKADFKFSDLFSQFHLFGKGFAQAFLRGLYTFLWTLLFIIPGIVKTYSYAMTPFILADNPDMTANEAITASREMMDGYKGSLFWLGLTFIGWDLLNVLTLGIGSLFLNPYINASYAAFYRSIKGIRQYTYINSATKPVLAEPETDHCN